MVSGSEAAVSERLGSYIEAGCGEVLAAPLIDPDDREGSFEREFSAIARADAAVRG